MDLLSEGDFIQFFQEEALIPQNILLEFNAVEDPAFEKRVVRITERFCREELRVLSGEILQEKVSVCQLFLDKGFTAEKIRPGKNQEEAFELSFTREKICIRSAFSKGLLQGLYTFFEILRKYCSRGKIRSFLLQDAPRVPVRGVHLYLPARSDLDFYYRFISRFLAPNHYNTVFLEVGGGMRLDRHSCINKGWQDFSEYVYKKHKRPQGPDGRFQDSAHVELAGGSFLEKNEVRDLAAFTREYGMELIPEIPSLTHSYYLTAGYRQIAELPDALWPDAYCPSNPRSREILFDVMEEYIEVLRPSMIHMGHDEWRAAALCPHCKGKAPELFAEDVCSIHDFLAERNIRSAMWADGLLPVCDGVNSYQCVDHIPRDILLLHWGWQFGQYQEFLSDKGFHTILGNFNMQMTPEQWEQTLQDPRMLGAEVSSWVGMNYQRFAVDGTLWQMLACANYLWEGSRLSSSSMDSLAQDHLTDLAGRLQEHPLPSSIRGTKSASIDLTGVLNVGSLVKNEKMEWAVDSLTPGRRMWKDFEVEIPDPFTHGYMKCVLCVPEQKETSLQNNSARSVFAEELSAGKSFYPQKVTFSVGKKVRGLMFFHFATGSFIRKDAPYQTVDEQDPLQWCPHIGAYTVRYSSGAEEKVDLFAGLNIDDFGSFYADRSKYPLVDAPPVIEVFSQSGHAAGAVGCLQWRNPHPEKVIQEVCMEAVDNSSGVFPVLLALNTLE